MVGNGGHIVGNNYEDIEKASTNEDISEFSDVYGVRAEKMCDRVRLAPVIYDIYLRKFSKVKSEQTNFQTRVSLAPMTH